MKAIVPAAETGSRLVAEKGFEKESNFC